MAQNLVVVGKDNKVVFIFGGVDLTTSTNIIMNFGSETYSTTGASPALVVVSATELSCDLSATNLTGKIFSTITYFDAGSVNGTDITSRELGNNTEIIIAIGSQLIIEDGTGVTGANSLATDLELRSYAGLRGVTLPATQPDRERLLVLAMDWLLSQEGSLKGSRTHQGQSLPYPRTDIRIYNQEVASDTVPIQSKTAQIEAAIAWITQPLLVNKSIQDVKKTKLDVLEKEFFEGGNWSVVRIESAMTALSPLMISSGFGLGSVKRSL